MPDPERKVLIVGSGHFLKLAKAVWATEMKREIRDVDIGDLDAGALTAGLREAPPERFDGFVATGWDEMGAHRRRTCEFMKTSGYKLLRCVSLDARVHPTASLGEGCFIGHGTTIGVGAKISPGCVLGTGVLLGDGVTIGGFCHIDAGAVIADNVQIGERCRIGTGVVVQAGVRIGAHCEATGLREIAADMPGRTYLSPAFPQGAAIFGVV